MSYKTGISCLKVLVTLVLLLFLQPSIAQKDFSELEAAIAEKQKILGKDYVVMIWKKDDSLIYKKEAGQFNSKTTAPVASCSKWFTAALVMILVDEKKISLDDPVSKYLPVFETYGKKFITIRHCLSHMTGIQSEPITLMRLLQRKKFSSLEEEVNAFAQKEIQANAGTEFRYSNIGLNIAGRIAEVVTRKKFDALIKLKLFSPLGMKNSTFSSEYENAVNPSGGARSTPDDYMKFLVMIMNKGVYQGQRILSEESVNEMLKVQTKPEQVKYAPKAAEGFNYALGSWVAEEKEGTATAIASPGLFGTWPMVDYCRGYAYLFFVKNLLGEERADAHIAFKKIIDKQMSNTCK
jgi:CubicO group peptidase (beta-lactamase class C family)